MTREQKLAGIQRENKQGETNYCVVCKRVFGKDLELCCSDQGNMDCEDGMILNGRCVDCCKHEEDEP